MAIDTEMSTTFDAAAICTLGKDACFSMALNNEQVRIGHQSRLSFPGGSEKKVVTGREFVTRRLLSLKEVVVSLSSFLGMTYAPDRSLAMFVNAK